MMAALFVGQVLQTEQGEQIFRGTLSNCRKLRVSGWIGCLPNGQLVELPGELPPPGMLVAINTGSPYTSGIYAMRRRARTPNPTMPPSPERDAEIYAKRKAGRTLRSLGEEYCLRPERVRGIAFKQERLEKQRERGYELSARALNCIRNALDLHHYNYWCPDVDPQVLAK